MVRILFACLSIALGMSPLAAQQSAAFKVVEGSSSNRATTAVPAHTLTFSPAFTAWMNRRTSHPRPAAPSILHHGMVAPHLPHAPGYTVQTDPASGQVVRIQHPVGTVHQTATEGAGNTYLAIVAKELGIASASDLRIIEQHVDELGHRHARLRQYHFGLEIMPGEATLHASDGQHWDLYTGRLQPSPEQVDIVPTLEEAEATAQVRNGYANWIEVPPAQRHLLGGEQLSANLVIFAPGDAAPRLAYRVEARPSLGSHETVYVDAHSGEEIQRYENISRALPPTMANMPDLAGRNQTIQTWQNPNGTFVLADATREMFDGTADPATGLIYTFDGAGGSPENENFEPSLASSQTNRDWTPTAVSVHHHSSLAYEYFHQKHDRNAIDGEGGDLLSIYDVRNADGTEMDNAFWNGAAAFYGNGDRALEPIAMALDVVGHELGHAVVQHTANLEYKFQSGALNESFADVFGYLIEGESGDYRIAEDIVRTDFFPSGALRNMLDPHNGGPGQNGYQPAHMNEYEELTIDENNGGVHRNNGIPNRAFALFTNDPAVGDARSERVYYRALSEYLTRSSQFVDARIAVVRAAEDLYGEGVANAARRAFDAVGIMGEQGGDYQDDLEVNQGDRFLLLSNVDQTAYYRADDSGNLLDNPFAEVGQQSRASITDDGSLALFVDEQNDIMMLDLATGQVQAIENQRSGLWRNVALSRDGKRFAVTTKELDNRIFIGDLETGEIEIFTLRNPTTAGGVVTNNVRYADIMEFSLDGEYLMYDALSSLDADDDYWDIGFIRVWDQQANAFAAGNIIKLYTNLEPGVSIGNPTFAKNSPYIIAFERAFTDDDGEARYDLVSANIETGESGVLWRNLRLNYPNFGVADDRIVFDAENTDGEAVLASLQLGGNKISRQGEPTVMFTGARWGQYYATGERDRGSSVPGVVENADVRVFPSIGAGALTIERPQAFAGELRIVDVSGRVVLRQALSSVREEVMGAASLAAGVYFVEVPVAEGRVVRRVVR